MRSAPLATDDRTAEFRSSATVQRPVGDASIPGGQVPRVTGDVIHPESWGHHRWGKTPALAPMHMQARDFELISPRDIMLGGAARLRSRLEAVILRLSHAGTRV